MEKVTLFSLERPKYVKYLCKYILMRKISCSLMAYDIGKSVNYAWGDSDYEYNYTIKPPMK